MPMRDSGGFLLSLVTESFAARALLGSLAAAALSFLLVGSGLVRSSRARRLLVLAPALTAAVAAIASVGQVYLPLQLWFTTAAEGATGGSVDVFGEPLGITSRSIDLLLVSYGLVVALLLTRRLLGLFAVQRTLRAGREVASDHHLAATTRRLANRLKLSSPRVMWLTGCPGGAFAYQGARRAVVAVDPAIFDELDAQEAQGLIAHELAHLKRRDTQLGTLVGAFRDVAFFLPPLHLTARWLRREQEESADELASRCTGRPVALASGILKVWDRSHTRPHLGHVCGAVPGRLALAPSGVVGGSHPSRLALVTARVERLIADLPAPCRLRRHAEVGLAAAVLAAGTSAALTVPSWIATDLNADSLSFVVLSAPAVTQVESPAFETFRSLTPPAAQADDSDVSAHTPAVPPEGCTCVESQADLLAGKPAAGPPVPSRLAWGAADRPAWDMAAAAEGIRSARPLWTVADSQTQVGFFLVSRSADESTGRVR